MIKVHLQSGETVEFDLSDASSVEQWKKRFCDPNYQKRITALTIVVQGVQYSLPRPSGFSSMMMTADAFSNGKGGERIICFAGDCRITVSAHNVQRAARVQLTRVGHMTFDPTAR